MTDEELWYQMRLNELPPDAMVAEAAQVDPALRNQVKVCPTVSAAAAGWRHGRRRNPRAEAVLPRPVDSH